MLSLQPEILAVLQPAPNSSSDVQPLLPSLPFHPPGYHLLELLIEIRAKKYDVDGENMYKLRSTPKIYACATMWHETENEMLQLLKSIFRMDKDQFTRKFMQEKVAIIDKDYYEFEGHIFFDDAYTEDKQINKYVGCLLNLVEKAGSAIHTDVIIQEPTLCKTPYGDRLSWILPGQNKLVAHLKDKEKIRHRKRWSQVMYMYYFLGHYIASVDIEGKYKVKRADNTFLLALDGDVDFEPSSVLLLLDRMKRNPVVGAACGRIHPIGSGPMVWYQKFEYAVSHWLQKSAEHMTGCVLCSPGCFSLFRGSALIKPNVLKRYTTMPTEAKHHVQYDQGEDRWLCTLLLQEGSRVEYCAASDALTYCPESFNEFFKQRRRWAPSTMANIMELLVDWRHVREVNSSISLPYIIYQTSLMAVSIITPATIFLLIVGALSSAFPSISLTSSMFINLVPVVIMLLLCFISTEDTQLKFASIITLFYTIAMMLVFVGLMKEIFEYRFCSTTAIFFTFVAGTFLMSAIAHPQEFSCILHGLLYFLFVPSTSILLIVYALGNLHNITWGTRDASTKHLPVPVKEILPPAKGKKTTIDQIKNIFMSNVSKNVEKESEYSFSCGNLFRCLCFLKEKSNKELTLLTTILRKVDNFMKPKSSQRKGWEETISLLNANQEAKREQESENKPETQKHGKQQQPIQQQPQQEGQPEVETQQKKGVTFADSSKNQKESKEHQYLKTLTTTKLSEKENTFWQQLIKKYLYPIDTDDTQKKEMESKLLELRNNVCLAFFIVNALFVIVIYAIEYNIQTSEVVGLQIPCSNKDKTKNVNAISFVFTTVFGLTLVIQLIAMFFHRYGTFLHIISTINLSLKPINKENIEECRQSLLSISKDDNDSDATTDTVCSISPEEKKSRRKKIKMWNKKRSSNVYHDLSEKADKALVNVVDAYEKPNNGPRSLFSLSNAGMNWMPLLDNDDIKQEVIKKTEVIKHRWQIAFDTAIRNNMSVNAVANALMAKKKNADSQSDNVNLEDGQENFICINEIGNDKSSSPILQNQLRSKNNKKESLNSSFETEVIVHSNDEIKIQEQDISSSAEGMEDSEFRTTVLENKLLRHTSNQSSRKKTNLRSKQTPFKRVISLLKSSGTKYKTEQIQTPKSTSLSPTTATTLTASTTTTMPTTEATTEATTRRVDENFEATTSAGYKSDVDDEEIASTDDSETDEEILSDNSDYTETRF